MQGISAFAWVARLRCTTSLTDFGGACTDKWCHARPLHAYVRPGPESGVAKMEVIYTHTLFALSQGRSKSQRRITECGGLELIAKAVAHHVDNAELQAAGCGAPFRTSRKHASCVLSLFVSFV